MGKFYDHITQDLQDFIRQQPVFFVATAPLSPEGHVNLSPKGMMRSASSQHAASPTST